MSESQPADNMHPNAVHSSQTTKIAVEEIVRSASAQVDRGRWFMATLFLTAIIVVLSFAYIKQSTELKNNYDIAWVKMYKDGTWDIEFHDSEKALQILPASIDSTLKEWVNRRFSELPDSVRLDYGYANLFMSASESSKFVSSAEGNFNAPQKAADIRACSSCPEVRYESYLVDHYESDLTTFGTQKGGLYRSNVYANKRTTLGDSSVDKRIVRIDWRLMSQDEIKVRVRQEGGKDWLQKNPIGLEIVNYTELDDVSDK